MVTGARLLLEGFGLLLRERRLWPLAATPVLLALLAVALAAALVWHWSGPLFAFVTGWLPVIEPGEWYTWIWRGPARFAVWLFGWLLFGLASSLAVALAFLLANVAAAPFLDALSRRVEEIVAGRVGDAGETGLAAVWRDGRVAIASELQRVLWFGGITALLMIVGVVIPGGQLVAPPLIFAFTALTLPLQYAGYALDRRRVPFRQRRGWIVARWPLMGAFGATAFLTFLVPGVNFLMVPALVVAGTLLVLRFPPERADAVVSPSRPTG